jgi:hypothetical protein
MKMTTYHQLVQRLRMYGTIPPFSQQVFMAWCLIDGYILVAWYLVKQRDNFTLIFILSSSIILASHHLMGMRK